MPRSMTRRQRRAQATRNRLERRHRLRETRRVNRSPPAYLPSTPTHMRIKKLLLTALSGSSGINPYKKIEHLGDHKVKDIEYDIFNSILLNGNGEPLAGLNFKMILLLLYCVSLHNHISLYGDGVIVLELEPI